MGFVGPASADDHGVHAVLCLFDTPAAVAVQRALLALERDQLLARMVGVSLVADINFKLQDGVPWITSILDVLFVDLVTAPASEGCLLRLRSRRSEA